jgi:hypothetical protein
MHQFRITITGRADPLFIAALIEDAKRITPEDGGFTFEYARHAEEES